MIIVNIGQQLLTRTQPGSKDVVMPVSTASAGVGQNEGSGQTPLGRHRVDVLIGRGMPRNAVFRGRRWTGEVYTEALTHQFPGRDWILSRIIWLKGLEPGVNLGGRVDSKRRYIYFHGTADEQAIGTPASHGCIRLTNDDVIRLFDMVTIGEEVLITT